MAEYVETGNLGRFLGFWAVFKVAAYSLGGPEFVSICAAEAVRPYRSIPKVLPVSLDMYSLALMTSLIYLLGYSRSPFPTSFLLFLWNPRYRYLGSLQRSAFNRRRR